MPSSIAFVATANGPPGKDPSALIQHVGGLFAAKEAVLKALGTGWAEGLGLRQVEIVRNELGAPSVVLHGAARERCTQLGAQGPPRISISHERTVAVAFAVLESA